MATVTFSSLEALETIFQQLPASKMKTDTCKNFLFELLQTFPEAKRFLVFDYDKFERILRVVMPSYSHEAISRDAIPVDIKAESEEEKIKSPFLEVDMNHPVRWLIPVGITLIGVLTVLIYVARILAQNTRDHSKSGRTSRVHVHMIVKRFRGHQYQYSEYVDDEVCSGGSADVDLGSRVKCPDESIGVSMGPGLQIPTMAVDVAVTQPYVSLLENARATSRWWCVVFCMMKCNATSQGKLRTAGRTSGVPPLSEYSDPETRSIAFRDMADRTTNFKM
ncbi:hypothetical protein V8E54_013485 [Elaphomyces granulatus]